MASSGFAHAADRALAVAAERQLDGALELPETVGLFGVAKAQTIGDAARLRAEMDETFAELKRTATKYAGRSMLKAVVLERGAGPAQVPLALGPAPHLDHPRLPFVIATCQPRHRAADWKTIL